MVSSTSPQPEKATLKGIKYSIPFPAIGSGYNVLNLLKDNLPITALQPFEKWIDPQKIELLIESEIFLYKSIDGQYRVHEDMQKQIFDELNSFKKDIKNLSDTDEILAMGIEACNNSVKENGEKLQELKNFVLEGLTKMDAMEKSIISTDLDLFKLQQVLIDSEKNPF
tara:strand:- start:1299 stop:1802 length:504 start_codon:yes stop_codon:yes gene_type:complete